MYMLVSGIFSTSASALQEALVKEQSEKQAKEVSKSHVPTFNPNKKMSNRNQLQGSQNTQVHPNNQP